MKHRIVPSATGLEVLCAVAVILSAAAPLASAHQQTIPVADAGPSLYAARDSVRLDGTGSYDSDGDPIVEYQWAQTSGPEIDIFDADTATPVIDGFTQAVFIQTVEIELVVSDGVHYSAADTVEVVIVPIMTHRTMSLLNGPFRPHLPTLITFGGGDCVDGGDLRLGPVWQERFNVISGEFYFPYASHAYQIVVMLSELAPEYDQPIQSIGFSTGGNPASIIPNIINRSFNDPRYAVNRMTILDSWCDPDLDLEVARFTSRPVADEPAWADVYRSFPEPIPGALNVVFYPDSDHGTPLDWYLKSAEAENWPNGDMYNNGVTGGFYLSVGGPARNLQINTDGFDYYFECRKLTLDCLQQRDHVRYPGLIPEPVTLIGPANGSVVWPQGAVLSCKESHQATSYELLFGPDPAGMTIVVSETPAPPVFVVDDLPFSPTYWTVRVRDAFGSTIFAPPRAVFSTDIDPVRRSGRRASSSP